MQLPACRLWLSMLAFALVSGAAAAQDTTAARPRTAIRAPVRAAAVRVPTETAATTSPRAATGAVRIAQPVPSQRLPTRVSVPLAQADTTRRATRVTTPVTIDRRTVETLLGSQGQAIRVVRDGKPTTVTAAETAVVVRPGDFVFAKMGPSAVRVTPVARDSSRTGGATVPTPQPAPDPATAPVTRPPVQRLDTNAIQFALPYRWFTLDDTAGRRVLVPYLILHGGGLTYDVARRIYRADALIGLEDSLRPAAGNERLVKPLRLQLTTVSSGRVAPVQLLLEHTGLDYVPVTVESPDSTSVRIRTGADTVGVIVPIPRRTLAFTVRPVRAAIAGFGLATTEIVLSPPPGVPRSDTAVLNLVGASLSSARVEVSGGGATVRLRSGLPGAGDSITALLDGVVVGGTRVRYTFPFEFLFATAAGLLLAGAARFVGGKRRKQRSQFTRDVFTGAPAGVIVACAAAVGLDLLGLKLSEPGSWAAVMVTSALGAFAGTKVLDHRTPSS
jgi:hypothetical protein